VSAKVGPLCPANSKGARRSPARCPSVAVDRLAGTRERGSDTTRPVLRVFDGAKVLFAVLVDHSVVHVCCCEVVVPGLRPCRWQGVGRPP